MDKYIKSFKEFLDEEGNVTVASGIASMTPVLGDTPTFRKKPKRRKTLSKENETLEESYGDYTVDTTLIEELENKWKFFTETSTGKMVFEIFNEEDHFAFQRGLRQNKPGYWRENPVTAKMHRFMNENHLRNFVIRYLGNDYRMMKLRGI